MREDEAESDGGSAGYKFAFKGVETGRLGLEGAVVESKSVSAN